MKADAKSLTSEPAVRLHVLICMGALAVLLAALFQQGFGTWSVMDGR